jgi:hypothetical protein
MLNFGFARGSSQRLPESAGQVFSSILNIPKEHAAHGAYIYKSIQHNMIWLATHVRLCTVNARKIEWQYLRLRSYGRRHYLSISIWSFDVPNFVVTKRR